MKRDFNVAKGLRDLVLLYYPHLECRTEQKLWMDEDDVDLIRLGLKTAELKYQNGKVLIPEYSKIDLLESKTSDRSQLVFAGQLHIPNITIKTIDLLTDRDGLDAGYLGRWDMIRGITHLYGPLGDDEMVTIYHIKDLI